MVNGDEIYAREAVFAHAPWGVPVFWLALFDRRSVRTHYEPKNYRYPSLVTQRRAALARLRRRRALVLRAFTEFARTYDAFASIVKRERGHYVKVDLGELWGGGMDVGTGRLRTALGWFVAPNQRGFKAIIGLAGICSYDPVRCTFTGEGPGVPRTYHLRGYYVREGYEDNADDT
jgi:hypothetical protein